MLYPEAGTVIYGCGKAANCDSYQCGESKGKRTGRCSSEWQGWMHVLMDVWLWQRKELLSTFITFTPASLPRQGGAHLDTDLFIWYKAEGHVSHKEYCSHTFQRFLYFLWSLTVIFQKESIILSYVKHSLSPLTRLFSKISFKLTFSTRSWRYPLKPSPHVMDYLHTVVWCKSAVWTTPSIIDTFPSVLYVFHYYCHIVVLWQY